MNSKTRKIKPVDISKISSHLVKLLNDNKEEVILNIEELKKAIKDKKKLSKLLPSINVNNKTKKFGLSREEEKTLSKLKTGKEIDDEQDKETEFYTALSEKRMHSTSTSKESLRKKLKRIFTKKSLEDSLQKYVNSKMSKKGGRKTKKNH